MTTTTTPPSPPGMLMMLLYIGILQVCCTTVRRLRHSWIAFSWPPNVSSVGTSRAANTTEFSPVKVYYLCHQLNNHLMKTICIDIASIICRDRLTALSIINGLDRHVTESPAGPLWQTIYLDGGLFIREIIAEQRLNSTQLTTASIICVSTRSPARGGAGHGGPGSGDRTLLVLWTQTTTKFVQNRNFVEVEGVGVRQITVVHYFINLSVL